MFSFQRYFDADKDILPGVYHEDGMCVEEQFFWAVISTTVLCLATLKVTIQLRIYEQFVILVELLKLVIFEIVIFMGFLIFFLILLSFVFRITGIIVPAGDYDGIHPFFYYGVQTFRNAIGDLTVPDVSFWNSKKEEGPKIATFMMYFGWIIWIFCVFMNQIVLFNFLIAIISKSYDDVMT